MKKSSTILLLAITFTANAQEAKKTLMEVLDIMSITKELDIVDVALKDIGFKMDSIDKSICMRDSYNEDNIKIYLRLNWGKQINEYNEITMFVNCDFENNAIEKFFVIFPEIEFDEKKDKGYLDVLNESYWLPEMNIVDKIFFSDWKMQYDKVIER